MLIFCALLFTQNPVPVQLKQDSVVVENGQIGLTVDRKSGAYVLRWNKDAAIEGVASEVRFSDGRIERTTRLSVHQVDSSDIVPVRDALGEGVKIVVHHLGKGSPELRQTFWVYRGRPEAIVQIESVSPTPMASNYLAPVVAETPAELAHENPLQSLFVPYDNDMYIRYRSDNWDKDSYEVGAVYDDGTRKGIVVGSLDHDVWKSGVRFGKTEAGQIASVLAYAGATGKATHDEEPHGTVDGADIRSPRMVLGFYGDWREGMERYGDLNALVQPRLPWHGQVPFGWSSWSGYKSKLQASDAAAATDFLQTQIPWFRSGGTAYLNLDSFWDNLTRLQRIAFVEHAHAMGLKAGIYFTPFVAWGSLSGKVRGTSYTYGDLVLRDKNGNPLPKVDGGWPLDPTHPGTIAYDDLQYADFISQGYDYIKLDFMTHGALEGRHYDANVATGAQAYAAAMRHIAEVLSPERVGRPIFIGLSIAPLFPSGFAHSRRVSCDVFANIGSTEYLLNSATYGWWTNRRLYEYNDPDSACVYQPRDESPVTEAEARSRFTASAISGGMMIEGDDLTDPNAKARVEKIYSNRALLDLARKAVSFRPVWGDTGDKAGDAFVWTESDREVYVAVFNYDKKERAVKAVPFDRLGLKAEQGWEARDLWTGEVSHVRDALRFELPPMDCAIVQLTR